VTGIGSTGGARRCRHLGGGLGGALGSRIRPDRHRQLGFGRARASHKGTELSRSIDESLGTCVEPRETQGQLTLPVPGVRPITEGAPFTSYEHGSRRERQFEAKDYTDGFGLRADQADRRGR